MQVDNKAGQRVRLGIVGCGAVSQRLHLPAVARVPQIECAAFVDKDLNRARQLAEGFEPVIATTDYRDLYGHVDAVLIALPNWLHASAGIDFLDQRVHVLVEKPMAPSVAECEAMVRASQRSGATLAVAHMRRFFPNRQLLKTFVQTGRLGELQRLEMSDGIVSDWPQSLGFFRKERAGGGVLIDMGVHELDILLWLLGHPTEVEYADDALGGVESNAQVELLFPPDVRVSARFSRTANLQNRLRLEGNKGWAELTVWDWNRLRYYIEGAPDCRRGPVESLAEDGEIDLTEVYARQLRSFATSVLRRTGPRVPGKDGLRVMRLVERCYGQARSGGLTAEGQEHKGNLSRAVWTPRRVGRFSRLQGKTALVTGATGFVGGRLAERLSLDEGVHVRGLVRRPSQARWLCRLPIEMVPGDVTDLPSLEKAMDGCDIVYHCAATMTGTPEEFQAGTVTGTENVVRAALKTGIERFIHLSTIAVHGVPREAVVDEQSPYQVTGRPYGDSKIEAEKIVFRYIREKGLPAVVVRPMLVYGPRCRWFTIEPIKKIRAGYMALAANGQGVCNANYIDNLVDALLLATENKAALGEVFIISDEPPVSWRDFLEHYAMMLGKAPLPVWPEVMLRVAYFLHHIRFVRRFVRHWPWLSPDEINQMKNQTRYDTSKARRILDYEPRVSLAEGMVYTRAWLKNQDYLS